MQRYKRLLIALVIFLSGTLLVPYFSWPDEAFGWKMFAQVYEPPVTRFLPILFKDS